jgi:NADPH-dependent ferric siderophore reductase
MGGPSANAVSRLRREPPPFRRVAVRRTERLTPRLQRVTLGGAELAGFTLDEPAASVRLLVPSPGTDELVVPIWNGNEFLLPDGRRPIIRTFTPRRVDPDALELDLEVVIHGEGSASTWAADVAVGSPAAVSGPGRGYAVDVAAPAFLLAGDETAIPAIAQLIEVLPPASTVQVHVELGDPAGALPLPHHPRATIEWHPLPEGARPGDALVTAVEAAVIDPAARVWVAGEAAAVQRVRRYLFEQVDFPRRQATVRGYWKHGRSATGDEIASSAPSPPA